jgi:predicted nucleotidyltransferase component of viral defense system
MNNSDQKIRELFHFLFLENLLRVSDSKFFTLKGGVNLRFFMKSPRYSEDMDLDVAGGRIETLKKNVYKILENSSFRRTLLTFGISDILINDPLKAKQTETTQRFRVRLVNSLGEEFPTKVEFSRRSSEDPSIDENIDPSIASLYNRLSYRCQHYTGESAVLQKIRALAGRTETQARDVFDLNLLYLGGYFNKMLWNFKSDLIEKAKEHMISISYSQYRDQVEEYLANDNQKDFSGRKNWEKMQETLLGELE